MSRSRSGRAALAVDVVVGSPLWNKQRGIKARLRKAIEQAASAAATPDGELAVLLTDDSGIRALNRKWRRKDAPTNVLSFPSGPARNGQDGPRLLGDIAIAYETTAREAAAEDKPFSHHATHLAVHGFLHLVGYDHEAETEAEAMERLEIAVLAQLKVPNPYIARGPKG